MNSDVAANISRRPLVPLLLALSGAHLLNDLIASMIPAMYPLLKDAYLLAAQIHRMSGDTTRAAALERRYSQAARQNQ